MTEPLPVKPLDYKTVDGAELPPQPLKALLLCLPGFICWWAFLEMTIGRHFMIIGISRFLSGTPLILCWLTAGITALVSLVIYRKARKPWYVWVNLIINVSGLGISVLLIGIFIYVMSVGFD